MKKTILIIATIILLHNTANAKMGGSAYVEMWWHTFSFGEEYVYDQNDYGRPAGWEFKNTWRFGFDY